MVGRHDYNSDEYPKILYTNVPDKTACANRSDPYQTASDQSLHCLSFHKLFCEANAKETKKYAKKFSKF